MPGKGVHPSLVLVLETLVGVDDGAAAVEPASGVGENAEHGLNGGATTGPPRDHLAVVQVDERREVDLGAWRR